MGNSKMLDIEYRAIRSGERYEIEKFPTKVKAYTTEIERELEIQELAKVWGRRRGPIGTVIKASWTENNKLFFTVVVLNAEDVAA